MSNSQARGVVLLESQAYERLVDASQKCRQSSCSDSRDAETQTEVNNKPDRGTATNLPIASAVTATTTTSSCPVDPVQSALDAISKYFRPACHKIIQMLPLVDSASGKIVWDGTPLHGITIHNLLVSTCVPFKTPPEKPVLEFLRQNGVDRFRNHLANEACDENKVRCIYKSWVSPYTF